MRVRELFATLIAAEEVRVLEIAYKVSALHDSSFRLSLSAATFESFHTEPYQLSLNTFLHPLGTRVRI
jgi:hypothetical protein